MRPLSKLLLGAAAGAGVLAFSALGASAAIVCSEDVCWHTTTTYEYPADARVTVHPDTWRWARTSAFAGANMKVAATGVATAGLSLTEISRVP